MIPQSYDQLTDAQLVALCRRLPAKWRERALTRSSEREIATLERCANDLEELLRVKGSDEQTAGTRPDRSSIGARRKSEQNAGASPASAPLTVPEAKQMEES